MIDFTGAARQAGSAGVTPGTGSGLYALTLYQPWADLIVDGIKPVENRTWAPPTKLWGERIAIHAGKTYDRKCAIDCMDGKYGERLMVRPKAQITLGAIVGLAKIGRIENVGHIGHTENPWFFGPWGWWLRDVVKIKPVPCKGAMGLWKVEGELLARVGEAYREATAAPAPVEHGDGTPAGDRP